MNKPMIIILYTFIYCVFVGSFTKDVSDIIYAPGT